MSVGDPEVIPHPSQVDRTVVGRDLDALDLGPAGQVIHHHVAVAVRDIEATLVLVEEDSGRSLIVTVGVPSKRIGLHPVIRIHERQTPIPAIDDVDDSRRLVDREVHRHRPHSDRPFDSTSFRVEHPEFTWRSRKPQPRGIIPSSQCGIGEVDLPLHLLHPGGVQGFGSDRVLWAKVGLSLGRPAPADGLVIDEQLVDPSDRCDSSRQHRAEVVPAEECSFEDPEVTGDTCHRDSLVLEIDEVQLPVINGDRDQLTTERVNHQILGPADRGEKVDLLDQHTQCWINDIHRFPIRRREISHIHHPWGLHRTCGETGSGQLSQRVASHVLDPRHRQAVLGPEEPTTVLRDDGDLSAWAITSDRGDDFDVIAQLGCSTDASAVERRVGLELEHELGAFGQDTGSAIGRHRARHLGATPVIIDRALVGLFQPEVLDHIPGVRAEAIGPIHDTGIGTAAETHGHPGLGRRVVPGIVEVAIGSKDALGNNRRRHREERGKHTFSPVDEGRIGELGRPSGGQSNSLSRLDASRRSGGRRSLEAPRNPRHRSR